jgi:hypothetical protein
MRRAGLVMSGLMIRGRVMPVLIIPAFVSIDT